MTGVVYELAMCETVSPRHWLIILLSIPFLFSIGIENLKDIFSYNFIKPAAPNALSIVTAKWMFLLMVWQKSQHHGILSNWFCLLPWPLEYPIQFSAIFTLRVFFLSVEKQEIWAKTLIYKMECFKFHIY